MSHLTAEQFLAEWQLTPKDVPDLELSCLGDPAAISEVDAGNQWDGIILDSDASFNWKEGLEKIVEQSDIPVLVISERPDEAKTVDCIKAGADNFFSKSDSGRLQACLAELPVRKSTGNSKYILRTLLNEVTDVIWVKDLQGRYIHINEAGAKVFQKPVSDIIGRNDFELFVERTAERILKTDLEVLKTGETVTIEDTLITLDGNKRYFMAVKAAYRDDAGCIRGVLGIIRDITERKQMEEELKLAKQSAEDANYRKSLFLTNLAHELRTPLHNIITSSSIALKGLVGILDPVFERYFFYINKSGNHLLQIIDDLLDISKIEAGKLTLQKKPIVMTDFMDEVTSLVQPLITHKQQVLVFDMDPKLPETFIGDPIRLKQILGNLLSNAHKFSMPLRKITLGCYTKPPTNALVFFVQDEGPGISPADLPRILQPFEQLETQSSYIQGTGLGLFLSKKLVELHDGTLNIYSAKGKGSTFEIEIPFVEPELEPVQTADTANLCYR